MLLSVQFVREALPLSQVLLLNPQGELTQATEGGDFCAKDEEVGVAVDSRAVLSGDLFVALSGLKVDGHAFIGQALASGAIALLVSKLDPLAAVAASLTRSIMVIEVADTLQAIVTLAKAWRSQLDIPVVGITGSVGKTTTKEMMRSILQAAGVPAFVSLKNQNTVLGICMNVLRVKREHKVAVLEIGISLKGEMVERVGIADPTIAVITNVGNTHAEGLGGVSGIAAEKRQIFAGFGPNSIGIINGDQELLAGVHYPHPVARFGFKTKNHVQARKVSVCEANGKLNMAFTMKWYGQRSAVTLAGGHRGYVSNALAAATAAYFLQLPLAAVVRGLEQYRGFEGRFEVKAMRGTSGSLISDCYNASPESMKAAIYAFDALEKRGRKIAVLGDMLELGEKEVYWHRQLGRFMAKSPSVDIVILVGQRVRAALKTMPLSVEVTAVDSWEQAVPALQGLLANEAALVLVKGSRGMQLNEMVKYFVDEPQSLK